MVFSCDIFSFFSKHPDDGINIRIVFSSGKCLTPPIENRTEKREVLDKVLVYKEFADLRRREITIMLLGNDGRL